MIRTSAATRNMVRTRSVARREHARDAADNRAQDGDFPQVNLQDPIPSTSNTTEVKDSEVIQHPILSRTAMPASSIKSEQPPPAPPASHKGERRSLKSIKGSTPSMRKKRQQLILEAETKKAQVRMELIDKKLDADLASLDEEYSSHDGSESRSRVEKWMDRSYLELNKGLPAPEDGHFTGEQCLQAGPPAASLNPPAPRAQAPHVAPPAPNPDGPPAPAPAPAATASTEGTVQMLASALRDLAAASASHAPGAHLLSRMSTPRELPEFSGDPMEWLQFKNAFEESTELCSFTPKENMWRLRKCLRGAAKEAVSALLVSASSPEIIISTLKLRFGNPEYILSKLVYDIKKLPPMSQDYHKEIVSFSVKIQNFTGAVRAVGREEYLQGMSVVSVILSKLPTVLLSRWTDYSFIPITEGKESRLVLLSDFLKEEAVKVSTTSNTYFVPTRSDQHKHKNSEYTQPRSQTTLMHTANQDSTKCLFCRTSAHTKITACNKFKKALRKVRWQFVKRSGLCFKCLLSRHDRDTCLAPVCDKDDCGQPHHPLLHYPVSLERSSEPQLAPAPAPHERQPAPATTPAAPDITGSGAEIVSHVTASDSEYKVLLKVVPIRIHSANGIIDSSALLDDGSTNTFISDGLAQRAGLRGEREMIRIRGAFNDELSCESIVTKVNLSGMDNKVYSIRARTVKNLNLPVHSMSVVDCDRYKSMSDIKHLLCTTDLKPEILIGQDNSHLLIPIEINLGSSVEPFATLSPLGWCVHGKWHMPRRASRCAPAAHATLLVSNTAAPAPLPLAARQQDQQLHDLHEEVRRSFALDSMGVCDDPDSAADCLATIRGKSRAGVQAELDKMQAEINESLTKSATFADIFRGSNFKAFYISCALVSFQQMSGINAVLFYMSNIFSAAGSALDPAIATIIIGAIQVVASCITPLVVDRLGRRLLLLVSSCGTAVGLGLLGMYFILADNQSPIAEKIGFLPILALVLFIVTYCWGLGPLPWAVMGELFPIEVKALASPIATAYCWGLSFLVTRYFNPIADAIGMGVAFLIFAVFCVISFFFTLFLVPETKGKSFQEIQDMLAGKPSKPGKA